MKRVTFNDYFNDNEIDFCVSGKKKYVSIVANDVDNGEMVQINLSHESILGVIDLLKENEK